MITTNNKRTATTTTTDASSSSTRAHAHARETLQGHKCPSQMEVNRAHARETLLQMSLETIRTDYLDILGRPMPRYTERQLLQDLQENETPAIYYRYALQEAASAPMPSWRYVLAIVTRLKRQQVPEEDLMWWM